jgi:aspartate kinase
MIDEKDVNDAIRWLHAGFFAEPDPMVFDVEAREVLAKA